MAKPERGFMNLLNDAIARIARLERNSVARPSARARAAVGARTGDIGWTARLVPPEGALLLNGQAVSRTQYADLFEALGTTFGDGDGSTTFNLPDARGRVLAHAASSGSFGYGLTLGAATHTLTASQMPKHSHGPGGTNGYFVRVHPGSGSAAPNLVAFQTQNTSGGNRYGIATSTSESTAPIVSEPATTATAGSGSAHNNVQPTLVLNAYIWT